jgi:hypothetical protein
MMTDGKLIKIITTKEILTNGTIIKGTITSPIRVVVYSKWARASADDTAKMIPAYLAAPTPPTSSHSTSPVPI